jgi:hypothetical protein
MGGVNEKVIESKLRDQTNVSVGSIRIHQSGNDVHFHDDQTGLKVSVPVSTFWSAWRQIHFGNLNPVRLYDSSRGTMVEINFVIDQNVIQTSVIVQQCQGDKIFQALSDFAMGK